MRLRIAFPRLVLLGLLLAALTLAARADDTFPVLNVGNNSYTNVTVTKVTATDIFFTYHGGMGNAKIRDLSPELQQFFSYALPKVRVKTVPQPGNKTNLQNRSASPPPASTPAPGPAPAPAPMALWRNDLPGTLKQAQAENKLILINFTGSDWCPTCIQFEKDVLSTPTFINYASRKLLLVKIDFPRHLPQRPELIQTNQALARQFLVDSYPTYMLLTPAGQILGRQSGYLSGGPAALIDQLESFSHN